MATDKKLSSLVFNTLTQAQYDSATKSEDEFYLTPDDTDEKLASKQDTLVSGTNIKTINGTSLLGSGDITISGGGGDTSDCAKKSEDNTFSGTNTFSKPIKADEIDNSLGNSMLRYKSTESNTPVVVGTSEKPMVLMGNGTRPTYSSSGSDFSGSELALKSDLDSADYSMHTFDIIFGDNYYVLRIICNYGQLTIIKDVLMGLTSTSDWKTCKTTIETLWSSLDASSRISQFLSPIARMIQIWKLACYYTVGLSYSLHPCYILGFDGSTPTQYVIYVSYPDSYTASEATGIKWFNVTTECAEYAEMAIIIDD